MPQAESDEKIQCEHMWVLQKDNGVPYLECHMCGAEKRGEEMWEIWTEGCKWHDLLQDLGFLYGEK